MKKKKEKKAVSSISRVLLLPVLRCLKALPVGLMKKALCTVWLHSSNDS